MKWVEIILNFYKIEILLRKPQIFLEKVCRLIRRYFELGRFIHNCIDLRVCDVILAEHLILVFLLIETPCGVIIHSCMVLWIWRVRRLYMTTCFLFYFIRNRTCVSMPSSHSSYGVCQSVSQSVVEIDAGGWHITIFIHIDIFARVSIALGKYLLIEKYQQFSIGSSS